MNILEFLKERKQILKVSAIALMGAAAVYMSPAHMSSAMVNGGDDGKPIESSQAGKKDTDNANQSASQQTTLEELDAEIVKTKAKIAELQERLSRLKVQFKDEEETEVVMGIAEGDTNIQEPAAESEGLSFDAVEGDSDVKIQEDISSTKAKEIEIGLKLIGSLPTDEEELKDFLLLPSKEEIDRHKETYEKIQVVVDKLVKSADEDKSDNSRQMKIANAIYCWVANNIKYIDKEKESSFEVFENGCGICRGYSHLTNLMMRMAGIPSLYIGSLNNKSDNKGHAFSAVFIDKDSSERRGWTLIDTTWAVPKLIRDGAYEQSLFVKNKIDLENGVNDCFVDVINDANEESVYSYGFDIKYTLKDIIAKYMYDDISTHIEQINEDISCRLCKINSEDEYKNIEQFSEIKIELGSDDKATLEKVLSNLKLVFHISKNAEKRIKSKNQERLCKYFPAFYNSGMSFKEANRQIISMKDHSVECLSKQIDRGLTDIYPLETETGLVYLLYGYEEDAKIFLLGNPNRLSLENVKIPEEVLSYGIPIKIGSGVKSLILKGDEEIDVSEAKDLENIELKSKEKYILEYGVLYRKNPDDTKGEFLGVFTQNSNGLKYKVHISEDKKNIEYVEVYSNEHISEPIVLSEKLPAALLKLKVKIGKGISALVLHNEEVDISDARDLEIVNTDKSRKYVCEQGALFERASMDKWQLLYGLQYEEFKKEDGNIRLQLFVYSRYAEIKIPEVLFAKYKDSVIEIHGVITTLILQGDEKIDIRAERLKNIDTTRSSRYIAEDGFLYERKDGGKGEVVGIFDHRRQVGDIGYIICARDDRKKVEKIIVDSKNRKILDLEALPPEITKYNVPIEIRSGVRSLKIKGDEEVELTCPDIEKVDVSESNKYIVEDGVLYAKDAAGNKGAQIVVFKRK